MAEIKWIRAINKIIDILEGYELHIQRGENNNDSKYEYASRILEVISQPTLSEEEIEKILEKELLIEKLDHKPTIEELEQSLNSKGQSSLTILPNGEIAVAKSQINIKKLASALTGRIAKPKQEGIREVKEPFNRPPSNHLEINYIAVGYYKHEIDFGVLGSITELSDDEFNEMLQMLNTAIRVAKEMRERQAIANTSREGEKNER